MRIQDISQQEIEQKYMKQRDEIQLLQKKVKGLVTQRDILSGLIVDAEKRIRYIKTCRGLLDDTLILKGGLPFAVVKLREAIINVRLELKRDDITVSRQKQLETEVVKLTANLKAVCPHTFLVQDVNYYEGSGCGDFEGGHAAHRICFVCGTSEYSRSGSLEKFTILYDAPERLIAWRYFNKLLEKILEQKENRGDRNNNFLWELTVDAIVHTFTDSRIPQLFSAK